jgi:hypothetical protein
MKTIRISRMGFPGCGQHSWMRFLIYILSRKYNVILDHEKPDLVLYTNLHVSPNEYDSFMKCNIQSYDFNNKNIKFLFVSGEIANFHDHINRGENVWSIGYENFEHERYIRVPSYVFDVWTLFDESGLTYSPFSWLTEPRNYDNIVKKQKGFCSITQASDVYYRGSVFDKLSEYKKVTSSGPWRANVDPEDSLNKYQWHEPQYMGRIDGLTYREKIEFFRKFKFNIAIQLMNVDYCIQEKLIHSYISGAVPIFYGNRFIEEEGFNPETFINLHKYENLDEFLSLVKKIDTNHVLHKKYVESPIFIDNKLPIYFNVEYLLNFFEKIINK